MDTNDRFLRKITVGQGPAEQGRTREVGAVLKVLFFKSTRQIWKSHSQTLNPSLPANLPFSMQKLVKNSRNSVKSSKNWHSQKLNVPSLYLEITNIAMNFTHWVGAILTYRGILSRDARYYTYEKDTISVFSETIIYDTVFCGVFNVLC